MADKLYTVVDGVPSPLDLGTGGSDESLPGIDERVTALEEYQTVQDEAIAQTRNELEATIEENKGILPVGMEYIRLTGQTPYPGGVDYLGQEATRAMYADLWTWKNEHKPESIISEEAWQAMYASQNGNVPFFSTGDGSTTFRFPRSVGYLKVAGTVGEIGAYMAEGLPDHTHTRGNMNITGTLKHIAGNQTNAGFGASGCFSAVWNTGNNVTNSSTSAQVAAQVSFNAANTWTGSTSPASESNPIYGSSSHVTPESMTVVMGVIAFGVTGAFGEATEEGIVQELELHGAKLGELEASLFDAIPTGFIVDFAGNTTPAGRWLPAWTGAEVSRTTYAGLFAVIGTTYGEGDGSSTFNLPNQADRVRQGSATAGTQIEAGLPGLNGKLTNVSGQRSGAISGSGVFSATQAGNWVKAGAETNVPYSTITFAAAGSSAVYGASDTVQMAALTTRPFIKY